VTKNSRSLTHPTFEETAERQRKAMDDWDRTLREGKAERKRQEELRELQRQLQELKQRSREPQPESPPEPTAAPKSPKRVTRQQRVIAFILKDLFPNGLPNDADRGLVIDRVEAKWNEACHKLGFAKLAANGPPDRRTIAGHIP
jgi:hypothetical protein